MNKVDYFAHNWLAFKINNESFAQNKYFIRGRVLDLGCGSSPYRADILAVADEYIGVDWPYSHHSGNHVSLFANIAKSLPFRNECIDTIVVFQVLEHIPEPELFLSDCFRVLEREGRLLLTVPFMWHIHDVPYDYYRYTRYGLEYILQKAGFAKIIINENTGYWQTAVLKFNYHTKRLFSFSRFFSCFLIPFWWLGQMISPALDKVDKHPEECASYTVICEKM